MTFQNLIDQLITDTVQTSLPLFRPELALCGTIVLMLLVRVFNWGWKFDAFYLALAGSALGLYWAWPDGGFASLVGDDSLVVRTEIFTGLLVFDSLTVFFRSLLLFFALLFVLLTKMTRIIAHEESADFYALVLGATLGMCLMASANHLVMVFLAVEMASVPSYVLAGILRGNRASSEASLKYSIYGAGTAGVMLYGISLLVGVVGSAHLPTMAVRLAEMDLPGRMAAGEGGHLLMLLALGGLMVMVGLAFKLSAVPFHFWCPDVFEGAPAEVGGFLSVASKAAALALLVRVSVGLGTLPEPADPGMFSVNDHAEAAATQPADETAAAVQDPVRASTESLAPVRSFIVQLIACLAIVTCTFGNLVAYGQTNIKRLLAYSTIAHAGYMMMPVAAALSVVGRDAVLAQDAIAALVFYIGIYLFMNLGAFAIVAFLRGVLGSEQIADYGGLVRSCPVTVVAFVVILFGLIGLPPVAGFLAKFAIFASLVDVGGPLMITLLVVAGLNTAISLVYYLRVIKALTFDPPPEGRGPVRMPFLSATYVVAMTLPLLVLFVISDGLYALAAAAATHLFL